MLPATPLAFFRTKHNRVGVHRTMQECMTAATEQKIPGNCYPVDKVIHQDNIEIPAGL
ncbi:DUF1482 family protein [Escherichia coli]|nr:DUF1482 family protein [Escherichia coli]